MVAVWMLIPTWNFINFFALSVTPHKADTPLLKISLNGHCQQLHFVHTSNNYFIKHNPLCALKTFTRTCLPQVRILDYSISHHSHSFKKYAWAFKWIIYNKQYWVIWWQSLVSSAQIGCDILFYLKLFYLTFVNCYAKKLTLSHLCLWWWFLISLSWDKLTHQVRSRLKPWLHFTWIFFLSSKLGRIIFNMMLQ